MSVLVRRICKGCITWQWQSLTFTGLPVTILLPPEQYCSQNMLVCLIMIYPTFNNNFLSNLEGKETAIFYPLLYLIKKNHPLIFV